MGRMNFRQVEVFKAIMTAGSVTDAARLLHVSVPAVSQVLSHTESQLGFPLFERIKGRLHPTTEAHRLYSEVELVYQGVQRIDRLACRSCRSIIPTCIPFRSRVDASC